MGCLKRTGEGEKKNADEFRNFLQLSYFMWVIMSIKMEWAHHVACVERYFKVSVTKDEGKRTFGEACKARRTINVYRQVG